MRLLFFERGESLRVILRMILSDDAIDSEITIPRSYKKRISSKFVVFCWGLWVSFQKGSKDSFLSFEMCAKKELLFSAHSQIAIYNHLVAVTTIAHSIFSNSNILLSLGSGCDSTFSNSNILSSCGSSSGNISSRRNAYFS